MFESSTTQPPKIIWPAARALAAEKTWLLQCLKAPLRNLPRLFGQEGGLIHLKSLIQTSHLAFPPVTIYSFCAAFLAVFVYWEFGLVVVAYVPVPVKRDCQK